MGQTSCKKVPVEICGRGCVYQEGEEECHEKQIDSLVDVPEEICDLNPQKTCHLVTKLVPNLKPKQECTTVPKETCNLKFVNPSVEKKPLRTEWCLEEDSSIQVTQSDYIMYFTNSKLFSLLVELMQPTPEICDRSPNREQATCTGILLLVDLTVSLFFVS